jgi:uncharacterized OB-fold protein
MAGETRPFSAASFYHYLREGKLMGSRSTATGKVFVPPRAICPDTFSPDMEWIALSGLGRLVAFTVIYFGSSHMTSYDRDRPYCAGIVELDEGVRISARILGVDVQHPETITIGTRLAVDFSDQAVSEGQDPILSFRSWDPS